MARLSPISRADRNFQGINREQSPWRALTVPYLSIMLASFIPAIFLAGVMPIFPPLGFVMLVAWRIMRPGLLPMWVGVPLGAFDDLFSGQPFGSAILLWSITMIALDLIENQFPWRGFWQDWIAASLAIICYILAAIVVSGAKITPYIMLAAVPQIIFSVLFYPVLARMVARLDRFRLARARRVG
ncbi:MAG: rod shape-determining protein MreD [Pseudomonadota bacterium]